ncbi:hypothetical protein CWB99_19600 [Pseudoalteromonas rubra]|uniref:Uncharacterized protein n=1 Tax=Pseudoalteromonas rubra TaxID=43658 RepID=A0A5S3WH04_9GAMM|nr:hypothetical protein [Pseudoalteromonas rubra]TMP26126.1 hypothetical protein CWB99_19600 [Pseudoalteromonas rubra]TMP27468.1 hypothetical protein CWC00_23280 [Pseudoalteromonas rubra]
MDIDLREKDIDAELDKLATFYESGGGYGDLDAEMEHQRKFRLLIHRKEHEVRRFNSRITVFNIALTLNNISLVVYQPFYKVLMSGICNALERV